MATQPNDIPVASPEADGPSPAEARALATAVAQWHRAGRKRKRIRDLTAEKYLLHVDGEGDAQWMDIVGGTRLRIQPNLDGGTRCTTNLLRPILSNFVAYHTAIPYRVLADPKGDRQSRDKARVDTIYANHVITEQRWNELFADALPIAAAYGFCPMFANWREENYGDPFEPIFAENSDIEIRPGKIDCWVGDPWSMVCNTGATRRSWAEATYERALPLRLVQQAFGDAARDLKGRKDMPSVARHQRIARSWPEGVHGSSVLHSGHDNEETIMLIYREIVPDVDPDYPEGRLTIVALSGVAEMKDSVGSAVLLHDGPLPGKRFSFVRLYPDTRTDDPYGYPWLTPLDELQIRRNQLETLLVNGGVRSASPTRVEGPGGIDALGDVYEQDSVVESVNGFQPYFMEYPTNWMGAIENRLQSTEEQMFRIGGWQAASRGESKAGDPAAKVQMLSEADDTVHGPANRALQGTLVEYMQLVHCVTREFAGPFPIAVKVAGNEYGYLASEYISADQMSEQPPQYMVTNGFGSTKEAVAQQLLQLVGTADSQGAPLLTAKQLRKQYPDNSIWPHETDVEEVKKRRVQAINYKIRDLVRKARGGGFDENASGQGQPPEWQGQAKQQALQTTAQQLLAQLDAEEQIERSDDLQLNIDGLCELVQDVDEDPLVRAVARMRMDMNYEWQAAQAQPAVGPMPQPAPAEQQQAEQQQMPTMPAGQPMMQQMPMMQQAQPSGAEASLQPQVA